MHYRYSALSETGREINGVEEGSLEKLKQDLEAKRYYILSIEPDIVRSIRRILEKRKISSGCLSVFFEDMSNMLKAGIALNDAIADLRETTSERALTKALEQVEDDLLSGFSLADSLERTGVFPQVSLSMIKVGERSGSLERALDDLSLYYSREALFLLELKNALVYPAVIFFMLVGIMFYVSFKVIPHLEALLPISANTYFATRALLASSHFLKYYWYVCPLFPMAIIFIYSNFKRSLNERTLDRYYRLPIVGPLAKDAYLAAFFSNLSLLQKNGVNIIDSLSLIEETTAYKALAKKVLRIKDLIESGFPFWRALQNDPFFPSKVCESVRKGEEMGSLETYLEKPSKLYFDKVSRRIRVILGFIQPAMLILCAIFLLFLVSAFLMPVYSNLSNIAGGKVKF